MTTRTTLSVFLSFLVPFSASFLTTTEHSSDGVQCDRWHQQHHDTAPFSPLESGRSHYRSCRTVLLSSSSRRTREDIYAAVHRKEYEMKQVNVQHAGLSDPIRMVRLMSLTSNAASPSWAQHSLLCHCVAKEMLLCLIYLITALAYV